MKCVHLWAPNIFGFKGGIQTYSEFLLHALLRVLPNSSIRVLVKQDKQRDIPEPIWGKVAVSCSGWMPHRIRTIMFALLLVWKALLERPQLIISTHLNFGPVALVIFKIIGIRYWLVAHGVDAWGEIGPMRRAALRSAEQILSVGDYTKQRLINDQGVNPERIVILHNTADEQRFQIRKRPAHLLERYRLNEEVKIILTVGRLDSREKYKGYDRVIEALPLIVLRHPTVHYLLVGKGDDATRVQRILKERNLENLVTLTGFVEDSELPSYYNLCDAFVMPSTGEGFGIVFLEALFSGKPCIAGNLDGSVDALARGALGTLIDPLSPGAIAEAVCSVLDDAAHQDPQTLRKRAIDTFGKRYFENQVAELLNKAGIL